VITDLESLKKSECPAFISKEAWDSFMDVGEKILAAQDQLHPILEGDVSEDAMEEVVTELKNALEDVSDSIDQFFFLASEDEEETADDETQVPMNYLNTEDPPSSCL
jgi:hypothetical protein